MSLADKLGNIYTKLDTALDDINTALATKGSNATQNIEGVASKISEISLGVDIDNVAQGQVGQTINLKNATKVSDYAFYGCKLRYVTISDSAERVGSYAFRRCNNLESVVIGNGVQSIGLYAFADCTNLKAVTIGNRITQIYTGAFNGCTNLTDIYLYSSPPAIAHSSTIEIMPSTTTIHVPVGSGEAYKSATNWSTFADNIVEDIVV